MREGATPLTVLRDTRLAAAAALICVAAAAGCGTGAGAGEGEVELTVSRDYGADVLLERSAEVSESDTVLDVLDSSAEVETSYGGGFVDSIDGLAGGTDDGRSSDWFFYVNGIESPVGSAEAGVAGGDRIWWDHHDWSTAMRVPAVVGSWPQPFTGGFEGRDWSTGVYCGGARGACAAVNDALEDEGVRTGADPGPSDDAEGEDGEIRVLVGPWQAISDDPVAALLAGGPRRSGVFATFSGVEPSVGLTLLDERGRVAEVLTAGAGLVAALRPGEGPPTWVVTGTDDRGVAAALDLLGDPLRDRFAAAIVENQGHVGVPVR
ncbi:MAG: DUF4430 domain-containing protein [Actinobacteria bacterium]|nr:DUF4430 domain-containing protein [Actinomycetota bacterium]